MRFDLRRSWWLLAAAGIFLVPWVFVLGATLPATTTAQHWATAWVGLDTMEAAGLLGTGLLLRRRDDRASLTAAATAMLLLVDAWFDVNTSAPGADYRTAVLMAVLAELPLALLCMVIAVRVHRGPKSAPAQQPAQQPAQHPAKQPAARPVVLRASVAELVAPLGQHLP